MKMACDGQDENGFKFIKFSHSRSFIFHLFILLQVIKNHGLV